jgi:hypothetical protein
MMEEKDVGQGMGTTTFSEDTTLKMEDGTLATPAKFQSPVKAASGKKPVENHYQKLLKTDKKRVIM